LAGRRPRRFLAGRRSRTWLVRMGLCFEMPCFDFAQHDAAYIVVQSAVEGQTYRLTSTSKSYHCQFIEQSSRKRDLIHLLRRCSFPH
jgi:hypothetical protein